MLARAGIALAMAHTYFRRRRRTLPWAACLPRPPLAVAFAAAAALTAASEQVQPKPNLPAACAGLTAPPRLAPSQLSLLLSSCSPPAKRRHSMPCSVLAGNSHARVPYHTLARQPSTGCGGSRLWLLISCAVAILCSPVPSPPPPTPTAAPGGELSEPTPATAALMPPYSSLPCFQSGGKLPAAGTRGCPPFLRQLAPRLRAASSCTCAWE